MTKTTFTEEAVRDLSAENLGKIIKSRVDQGVRSFEIVTLDEALGRLSAIGEVVDHETTPAPIEVEPRYSAPTSEEVDDLAARIASTGYASDAVDVVEDWIETKYGVVGDFRRRILARTEDDGGPE